CDILIINGAGFEEWLNPAITDAMENIIIVEASKGLEFRPDKKNSIEDENEHNNQDPHFWLNPYLVVKYVKNISDTLTDFDPPGKDFYEKNAENYSAKLLELDKWIMEEVKKIPLDKRLLITNHESFGYFADRYGFKIIGTIIPGSSTAASPSAKEVAQLIDQIKALNVGAIFLETGSDPKIAQQIANETGVAVITGMHTHSLTGPDGDAPTYIDMIKNNTIKIVESLK
ncbi:MAG: zinc ABC transporter substrate-binding protein, partial [Actinobacteria bacterium]|nr:zinc ABC transporter substrate-binding protein [Actinomycetota bacterium]